ncbi:hypothetical protein CGRA01v4_13719 [Colletotrichum graminicola]|nr:hypothetical protein CGRA01v4_13719 [Colletotrichum graminicola]
MVPTSLADRRDIELSELENFLPLPCSARVGWGPPSLYYLYLPIRPCLVRNLKTDHDQSGTDQHSQVAQAKSQSIFDGVVGVKGGDEAGKVEADKCP